MRKYRKKKNKLFLITILVLMISIGYALLSSNLNITGIAGINKNKWDIHWENVKTNASSTVTADTPVIDENRTKVTYSVELELPGDYYEFDVDAKNDGTIDASITDIRDSVHLVVEEGEDDTLPDYIKYSVVYKDTTTVPVIGDVLKAGEKQTYTVRIEYDKNATELPSEAITIKADNEIDYGQYKEDPNAPYKITFNPNGGSVTPTGKTVDKKSKIGVLPIPTKEDVPFLGWYTELNGGIKVTKDTIPSDDVTYYAHWADSYTTFDTGINVNQKMKKLALNGGTAYWSSEDTNIASIERTNTEPTDANKTEDHLLSVSGQPPIYAWYENNTIYWWTSATIVFLNEDASNMFYKFNRVNNIDSSFYTNKTTNMSSMFSYTTSLMNIDLSNWDTSNVENMSNMFQYSRIVTLDLSSFDTSKVSDMYNMFNYCEYLTTITVSDGFSTKNVSSSGSMFYGCQNLVGGRGTVYDSNHTDAAYAHYDYSELRPGYFNAGEVTMSTITFNANGGTVDPTSKQVITGTRVKELPVPVKNGLDFNGWYTGLTEGSKVTPDTIVTGDITFYARYFTDVNVIYDANTGEFDNSEDTKTIKYSHSDAPVTLYSHTGNIDDYGIANSEYNSNINTNDVVTIPGSAQLEIEVWYSTESASYDWLAIYPKGVTPDQNNYSEATISGGKLAGHGSYSGYTKPSDSDTTYHRIFTVDGDTAQFYFKSDGSGNYYGYYAKISGTGKDYVGDKEYQLPVKAHNRFLGWNTEPDGSGTTYNTQEEIIKSIDNSVDTITLYAQWEEIIVVTFDASGGNIQDNPTRIIKKGDPIGELPNAINSGFGFVGWYFGETEGIKVDKNYVPENDLTLYAHWNEIEALFDSGPTVSIKFKTLAGNNNPSPTTNDTNVMAIRRSTTAPDAINMTSDNIVSAQESKVPIYAWFDNGTIYWWSEANKEYTYYDASYMFCYFKNAKYIDTSFDTSITQNMYYMFGDDNKLESIDVSNWNTANVVNMQYLFAYCYKITTLDVSGWDIRNVTNMDNIFYSMSDLYELNMSGWNFAKYNPGQLMYKLSSYYQSLTKLVMDDVVFPSNMYRGIGSINTLEEISLKNVDTSNVVVMSYMFDNDSKLKRLDLSNFDTSNVVDMSYMFNYCSSLQDVNLSGFDTSKVGTFSNMFYGNGSLKKIDLSMFDTSNATVFSYMLGYCNNLEEVNLSNWDFRKYRDRSLMSNILGSGSNVKILVLDNTKYPNSMDYAFGGLNNLEVISLNNVDTSNVTNMYNVFDGSKFTELDVTSFDTSKVTEMSNMFSYLQNLVSIYVSDSFVTDQVSTSNNMFYDSPNIVGGLGTVWDSNHLNVEYAHYDGGESNPGYFNAGSVEKYLVTFSGNNGTVNETSRYVIKGKKIGLLPTPYRENYVFDGWYTELTGGIEVTNEYIPNSDVILYARWHEYDKYTIEFNAMGGSVNPTSIEVISGNSIKTLPKPIKEANIFDGWYTDQTDGSLVDKSYVPVSNMTLYARWRTPNTYTITLNANGGEVTPSSKEVLEGNMLGELPTPTWSKHHFVGWYTDMTAGTYVGTNYEPNGDVTLYARWKNIYTVTFDPNGGTVNPTSVDIVEGSEIWDLPTPTYQYNKFDGWWTSLTDGTQVDYRYRLNSDITIVAKWIPIYEVTLDAVDGTVNPSKLQVVVGENVGNLPVAKGANLKLFTGWHLDSSSGEKIDSSYIPDNHVTVYASYKTVSQPNGTEDDSLEQMEYEQQQGRLCTTYPLGLEKEINMGPYGMRKVRLSNCSKISSCSDENFSQTACGLVWEFTDIITYGTTSPIGYSNNNEITPSQGGWRDSKMRAFVNNEIYNAMPSEWKDKIIDTRVISGHNIEESDDYVTTDKLYLLSAHEVWKIDNTDWANNTDSAYKKTRQLDYYKEHNVRSHGNNNDAASKTSRYEDIPSWYKYPEGCNTSSDCVSQEAYRWYLRHPAHVYGIGNFDIPYVDHEYMLVTKGGDWSSSIGSNTHGVSPAFRTGN